MTSPRRTAAARKPALRKRRSHAERKAETRARLLRVAWDLFLEQGYEGASLNAIADRAGYTRTPIHQMFGDKGGLYAAVWQDKVRELGMRSLARFNSARTVTELLRAVLDHIVKLQDDPTARALRRLIATVRLLAEEDAHTLEHFVVLELESLDRFAERLRLLSAKGPPLAADPRRVARRIDNYVGGLQEMAHPRVNPIDRKEALQAMLTLAYGRVNAAT